MSWGDGFHVKKSKKATQNQAQRFTELKPIFKPERISWNNPRINIAYAIKPQKEGRGAARKKGVFHTRSKRNRLCSRTAITILTKRGFPSRPSLGFLQDIAESPVLHLDIHPLRGFAACGVNAKKEGVSP